MYFFRTHVALLCAGIAALALFTFSSCKKTEAETMRVYQDSLVTGNTVPPYAGVTTTQIENYINRLYIDLLGREPADSERTAAVNYLKANSLSDSSRDTVVQRLFVTQEYHNRFFEVTSERLLNGTDSLAIAEQIALFEYVSDSLYAKTGDSLAVHQLALELDRFYMLRDVKNDYKVGSITINEYFRRIIMNYFYDQINMGSENFVKSCFENLFVRKPSSEELANGIKMVDGTPSMVLLKDGVNKNDFVAIVTGSADFYQGLVIAAYKNILLRTPTSTEMSSGALDLFNTDNYYAVQKKLLKSKEYAGF